MLDEFDDDFGIEDLGDRPIACSTVESPVRPRVARLVSRLYGAANAALRTRVLACLVRPLGLLGLAGVASGAFAGLPFRADKASGGSAIGDLAGYTSDQIFELARFVEQVSPDAIQQVAGLLADNPAGVSAFSAAAALLLVRAVRSSGNARTRSGHGSSTALNELVSRARERLDPDPTDGVPPVDSPSGPGLVNPFPRRTPSPPASSAPLPFSGNR